MTTLSKKLLSKFGFQIETKGNEVGLACGMEVDADKTNFAQKIV